MKGFGNAISIIFGIIAAVLFVIAYATYAGYLGAGGVFDGTTTDALIIYGVISTVVAVGGHVWDSKTNW